MLRINLKLLIAVLFCLITKLNYANDTIKYNKPHVGMEIIIPAYFESDKKRESLGIEKTLQKISKWKDLIDSFKLQIEVHSRCNGNHIINKVKTQIIADTILSILQKNTNNCIDAVSIGMGSDFPRNKCKCDTIKYSICSEAEHEFNNRYLIKVVCRK